MLPILEDARVVAEEELAEAGPVGGRREQAERVLEGRLDVRAGRAGRVAEERAPHAISIALFDVRSGGIRAP